MKDLKTRSLEYHKFPIPGKLEVISTKPCETQDDLSLAYSPGVADPCLEIEKNPDLVWELTTKGNTIAVISDGTAVLGLGNIGPEPGLPVMEGKSVLFKQFAGVNAYPLCLKNVFLENGKTDPKKVIEIVAALEPSLGGVNLEDFGSPACFEIEQTLKKEMNIPVFHDDQHGTAIISLAGVLNALETAGKKIEDVKVVVSGAGAAGIACSEFYISAGVKRENLIICDSKGVVYQGRSERMTAEKEKLATKSSVRTLTEAMVGADIFIGLSMGNIVNKEMVSAMADKSIIFAMANPTPEISPVDAIEAGAFVVGTGRSDFHNQVNNVLGFPGIFRGALDVRASDINEDMKVAAAKALAEVAKEEVPADVLEVLTRAYPEDAKAGMFNGKNPMKPEYVIPKPFDPRIVPKVARYVAEAAMKCGIARVQIADLDAYEKELYTYLSATS